MNMIEVVPLLELLHRIPGVQHLQAAHSKPAIAMHCNTKAYIDHHFHYNNESHCYYDDFYATAAIVNVTAHSV